MGIKKGKRIAKDISEPIESYFKNSDGSFIEFYHGASTKFDEFDLGKLRTGADAGGQSWYGDGIYLSGEPWKGRMYSYANPEKGYVSTVVTSVKKPLVVRGTSASDWSNALKELNIPTDAKSEEITKILKNNGYDSIAVLSDRDENVVNELIVFDSKNTKIKKWYDRESFDFEGFDNAKLPT